MIRKRMVAVAVSAVSMAGLAAGFGVPAASASVSARSVVRPDYTCHGGDCQATAKAGAKFYPRSGSPAQELPAGTYLEISCYYGDSDSLDGYSDHVYEIAGEPVDGHVQDTYVDFGGLTPNRVGLSVCKS